MGADDAGVDLRRKAEVIGGDDDGTGYGPMTLGSSAAARSDGSASVILTLALTASLAELDRCRRIAAILLGTARALKRNSPSTEEITP